MCLVLHSPRHCRQHSALLPSLDPSITINTPPTPCPKLLDIAAIFSTSQWAVRTTSPLVKEEHSTSGPQTGQDPMVHLTPKQDYWGRCWMVTRRSQDRGKKAKEIVWKIKCFDGRQGPLGLLT